jgi:hypothetical protein
MGSRKAFLGYWQKFKVKGIQLNLTKFVVGHEITIACGRQFFI